MTRSFGLFALCLFNGAWLSGCKNDRGAAWAESSAPQIRVNQVGYLPGAPKVAAVRTTEQGPLAFQVLDAEGKAVFSGKTQPFGPDRASGERVHHADFSPLEALGSGYVVKAGELQSFPFDVHTNLYSDMKVEALRYFYHNRSGIAIVRPYVTDQDWSRPAGHVSDVAVPCWKKDDCSYTLDVQGGWYDAGDHGKYVVNGGISVWTLLNLYERTRHTRGALQAFGDRSLNIPESGNGVPDILDEVRWELEFLLKMQVPEGHPQAGMAHHKIHDNAWSALGFEPPSHATNRALHPPSTAATLNLAATTAQAARVYRPFDQAFAERCLNAALRAWAAARRHPEVYASKMDNAGGGPYDDKNVSDEFYWAAAELYLTRQDPTLGDFVTKNQYFQAFPATLGDDGDGVSATMTWQSVQALGSISLALVPSSLPDEQRHALRQRIVKTADTFLEAIASEGYRLPIKLGAKQKYPWGSNSFVLNNMIVLALAFDFTGEAKYAGGVSEAMDYLLGRNPMARSYVTGYGEVPLENPHHRFWAASYHASFPPPPPGVVSGGPNSSIQDPQARKMGLSGCAPQKCFVDHIEAWSVNEITINWNAPFAWVTAFLDEQAASTFR